MGGELDEEQAEDWACHLDECPRCAARARLFDPIANELAQVGVTRVDSDFVADVLGLAQSRSSRQLDLTPGHWEEPAAWPTQAYAIDRDIRRDSPEAVQDEPWAARVLAPALGLGLSALTLLFVAGDGVGLVESAWTAAYGAGVVARNLGAALGSPVWMWSLEVAVMGLLAWFYWRKVHPGVSI